jgi:hypothetical protein
MAEDRQIPGVLGLLTSGVGQCPPNMPSQRAQQRTKGLVATDLDFVGGDRGDLLAAQRVTQHAQIHIGDLRPAADALLDAEQHLHHDQRGQCPQVHLPGLGDARFPGLPPVMIQVGIGLLRCPPALVVGVAVAARAIRRPGACRQLARRHRREGPHPRIGEELLQRHRGSPEAELLGVRLAQHRLPHRRDALASWHRAVIRRHRLGRQLRGGGDLRRAHSHPGQPGEAPMTHCW